MRSTRVILIAAIVGTVFVGTAAPAAAHGVGGRDPTNVRVRVFPIEPAIPGVEIRLVEFDDRLELRNTTAADVVVLGYTGEPYLRVGPDGVHENVRSPAVFVNRTNDPPASVPARFDASAPPEWRRLGDDDVVRWHDHRAHPMGQTGDFVIGIEVGGRTVEVRGDITIVRPGAWWPWLLVVAGFAVVVTFLMRRRWRATVATTLSALIVAESVRIAESWHEISSSLGGRVGAQLIPIGGVVVGIGALGRVLHTDAHAAAPAVLVAAVVFVVAGGVSDVSVWWHSQIPSSLSAGATRALVAITLGAGIGLAIAAGARLAPATPAGRTPPTTSPTAPRPS
ncbi:MAG: hypothetical protein ACT4OX_12195 [Actinomycetota bacterium]